MLAPPPGGVQRVTEDVALAFPDRTVRIVGVSAEAATDPRFRVVRQWRGPIGKPLTLMRYFAVAMIELRKQPTMVQAMTWRSALPTVVAGRRRPVVLFCHGAELIRTKGGPVAGRLRRWMLRRATAVVANSEFTAGLVREIGGRNATLTHPPLRSLPDDIARSDHAGPVRILSVGRLVANKGHARLVNAVGELRKRGFDVSLTIAGPGPDHESLIGLIARLELVDAVHLAGAVTDDELDELYRTADVFALLSVPVAGEVEGWGIVFLEAAGYGLPVVAGRSGGAAEAVEDGVTGVVVTSDAEAVDALAAFVADPARARAFGERGRARVTRYLLPAFRDQLADVYTAAAKAHKRGVRI